jgi:hypothetical protein
MSVLREEGLKFLAHHAGIGFEDSVTVPLQILYNLATTL